MENETSAMTETQANAIQDNEPATHGSAANSEPTAMNEPFTTPTSAKQPTRAKVIFEQVELFELDAVEARDTEYLRKLLEPHYSAATDAKFEYRQEGETLVVTMIKQNPPKG